MCPGMGYASQTCNSNILIQLIHVDWENYVRPSGFGGIQFADKRIFPPEPLRGLLTGTSLVHTKLVVHQVYNYTAQLFVEKPPNQNHVHSRNFENVIVIVLLYLPAAETLFLPHVRHTPEIQRGTQKLPCPTRKSSIFFLIYLLQLVVCCISRR